jgi:hypothetical protein
VKAGTMTALTAATLLTAATAMAQTESGPLQDSNMSSDPDMSSASVTRPEPGMEARMSGVSAGTRVQSPAGESLGGVQDIVPNSDSGRPDYVRGAQVRDFTLIEPATIRQATTATPVA